MTRRSCQRIGHTQWPWWRPQGRACSDPAGLSGLWGPRSAEPASLSAGWEPAWKQSSTPLRRSLCLLVFTAGFMVKKSASDASISSGTHGQYSILQTAKLLPGAPQQAVSSVLSSKRSPDVSDPRGWPRGSPAAPTITRDRPFSVIASMALSFTLCLPTTVSPRPLT